MIVQKFKRKILVLGKTLKFIYFKYPLPAILRDILFLILTASEIYGITVLGKFIDETTNILLNWTSFNLKDYIATDSFYYLLIILLLWIVGQICKRIREYLYHIINENVWMNSQREVLQKISSANLEDVETEDFQDMLVFVPSFSITRIVSAYENFSAVLSNIIRLISAGIILFGTMRWSVFLFLLFVLPETVITHVRRKQIRIYQDVEVGKIKFLNYIQNLGLTIANFSELRVNNIYSYLKRKYGEVYGKYIKGLLEKHFNFTRDQTIYSILGEILKYGYIVYVLAISIVKGLTFGTFKALFDYVGVVYSSIYEIINAVSLMSNNLEYIGEFFDLVEYQGFGDYRPGRIKLEEETPTLEFKNLNFKYPDDPRTKILSNLNFELKPGEKIAFFGGDGSGRTTVVKILAGLYRVNEGEYLIDGYEIQDLARGQLKKKLSVIFQDFIDYHFSLEENIVIAGQRKNVDRKLLEKVSRIAQVDKFKKQINLKNSNILGKTFPSGKELSPGYWQRLSIARMLYRDRNIFVMDEPFTFIDDISARGILKDMFEFVGDNRSIIYITRSMNLLEEFDRIYYFDKGKIVESGSWNELMKKQGRLYREAKKKS
ncbi:MAG: ABC transporter ATP-binding protein [Candidatus Dojkabacteria bacterium]